MSRSLLYILTTSGYAVVLLCYLADFLHGFRALFQTVYIYVYIYDIWLVFRFGINVWLYFLKFHCNYCAVVLLFFRSVLMLLMSWYLCIGVCVYLCLCVCLFVCVSVCLCRTCVCCRCVWVPQLSFLRPCGQMPRRSCTVG